MLLILVLIPASWLLLALFGLTLLRLAAHSDGLDSDAWEEWRLNSPPVALRDVSDEEAREGTGSRRRASG